MLSRAFAARAHTVAVDTPAACPPAYINRVCNMLAPPLYVMLSAAKILFINRWRELLTAQKRARACVHVCARKRNGSVRVRGAPHSGTKLMGKTKGLKVLYGRSECSRGAGPESESGPAS